MAEMYMKLNLGPRFYRAVRLGLGNILEHEYTWRPAACTSVAKTKKLKASIVIINSG